MIQSVFKQTAKTNQLVLSVPRIMLIVYCVLLSFTSLIKFGIADFECLCNYHVEIAIYPEANMKLKPMGHLYEFDCKATYPYSSASQPWQAIQYEKQVGYVFRDDRLRVQTCPGDPDPFDTVPTTTTVKQTTIPTTSSTMVRVTNTKPTTKPTTVPVTTALSSAPTVITSTTPSRKSTTATSQAAISTTTMSATSPLITKKTTIQDTTSTTTMSSTQTTTSTPLPTTTIPSTSTPLPTTTIPTTSTPLPTTKTTTRPSTSTSTHSTSTVPSVSTTSTAPTTVRHTTKLPTTTLATTTKRVPRCPSHLPRTRYLREFGGHCYEFILSKHSEWPEAERDCTRKGGHLVTITSVMEQNFIYNSLRILNFHGDKGVWIGFTDKDHEGKWRWSSGESVHYTSWADGQPGIGYLFEDCALFDMGEHGRWGDYSCEGVLFNKQDHGWICEYNKQ